MGASTKLSEPRYFIPAGGCLGSLLPLGGQRTSRRALSNLITLCILYGAIHTVMRLEVRLP